MSSPQQFEVEQKFPLSGDVQKFVDDLLDAGAQVVDTICQTDQYYNHPVRDFASTDEALRIRSVGDENWLTWKGPRLASTAKTRREIELPLGAGGQTREQLADVLQILAFHPVATVQKQRRRYVLPRDGWDFEIAIDEVDDVGSFVEIELLASREQMEAAQQAVIQLGQEFGLTRIERRSYLAMLLESRGETDAGE